MVRRRWQNNNLLFIKNAGLVVGLILLAGCFADVQSLPSIKVKPVFAEVPPTGDTMIGIALSGGGSRAAYFGAAGLQALAHIRQDPNRQSLLERVSYLSSVSGGSVASSYFAMHKPAKNAAILNPDGSVSPRYVEFFKNYLDTMASNFQRGFEWRQLYKVRWLHSNQRATSLAEELDSTYLNGATFSDLYDREKVGDTPRLILNATFYNTGKRAAMTTLPSDAFKYYFIDKLQKALKKRAPDGVTIKPLPASLQNANDALLPQTFDDLNIDASQVSLSRAVAASASFPPLIGPITVQIQGDPSKTYHHIGDGGLFDNQGTESLVQLMLKLHDENKIKKALIIAFDSSFPFTGKIDKLNHLEDGFKIFTDDPGRIVGIMEVRANAYQSALWHTLQQMELLLPKDTHFRVIVIRHTDDVWPDNWQAAVPSECSDEAKKWGQKKDIVQHLALIPTLFKINSECDRALLDKAARLGVEMNRAQILAFLLDK
ncbi:MAG: patatin-like phospholipase family protein [Pyrinomonadaceae bacterium]|nr:patatin-like phospholipase family protein [Pyrinomonadaceae bacterium]